MCNIDDGDFCTVLHDATPKARKPHICSECGRTIEHGETYRHHATLYEGRIETHKCCAHCDVARDWLFAQCDGWSFNTVREEIIEHYHEGYTQLGRFAVSLRRRWRGFRGQLLPIPGRPPTSLELARLEQSNA